MTKTSLSSILIAATLVLFSACKKDDGHFTPHNEGPDPAGPKDFARIGNFTESLTDISFSDNQNGIVVGTYGFAAKTNDGGYTWTVLNKPTSQSLMSAFCLNKDEMFASRSWLHYTKNGGSSFSNISGTLGEENSIKSIKFFNSNHGFIIKGRSIWKTTDGGANWEGKSFTPGYLKRAQFLSQNVGYIYGGITFELYSKAELYKTTDGGNTWTSLMNSEVPEIIAAHFVNENIGYYASYDRKIYKTTNGGASWTMVTSGFPDYITDLAFVDDRMGYLTTYGGKVYKTDDGSNWEVDFSTSDTSFNRIIVSPDKRVWVAGNDGILLRK